MKKNLAILFSMTLLFSCSTELVDSNLVSSEQTNISSTTKSTKQTIVPKSSKAKPAKSYIPLKPDEVKKGSYYWIIYAGTIEKQTPATRSKILDFMQKNITPLDMSRYTIDNSARFIDGKDFYPGYYFEVELYDVPSKSLIKAISKDLELYLAYSHIDASKPGLRLQDEERVYVGPSSFPRW